MQIALFAAIIQVLYYGLSGKFSTSCLRFSEQW